MIALLHILKTRELPALALERSCKLGFHDATDLPNVSTDLVLRKSGLWLWDAIVIISSRTKSALTPLNRYRSSSLIWQERQHVNTFESTDN